MLGMNRRGHPDTLVASQPGNVNAVKQGVHSPRLIQARAAELESELTQSFEFSPTQRLAVHETARCMAILEAIDRDLDERGLEDKRGQPRYSYAILEIARGRGVPRLVFFDRR